MGFWGGARSPDGMSGRSKSAPGVLGRNEREGGSGDAPGAPIQWGSAGGARAAARGNEGGMGEGPRCRWGGRGGGGFGGCPEPRCNERVIEERPRCPGA